MAQHTVQKPLLLETIKCDEGVIHNLSYHQKRCNTSRQILYHSQNTLDLHAFIQAPPLGKYRCRIVYGESIHSIEYIPYTPKEVQHLKIIPSDFEYNLKYANRDEINTLFNNKGTADDIIIEKNGYLTDTSIANIAFYDGERWFTPATPLLKGTMRQKLIDEGVLHTRDIKKEELSDYTQVALMNAMLGFKILNHFNIQ